MKHYILASVISACTLLYLPAIAEQVRQLTWQDLVPAGLITEDPFAKLTSKQQDLLIWVINTIQQLPKNGKNQDEIAKEMAEAVPELRKAGVDVKKVMAKIKEIQTAIVHELNGQHVRIPGYLLPLEMSGDNVTEFLLVPYVGACIHVPPPPPNQIIYVKVAQEHGYDQKKIFEPVWATGVISAKSMVKDLFLVDGTAGIDIGYSMQAERIEPYK
jgi:hypothetical protein